MCLYQSVITSGIVFQITSSQKILAQAVVIIEVFHSNHHSIIFSQSSFIKTSRESQQSPLSSQYLISAFFTFFLLLGFFQ
jgi:hypothetical protein